ncbi:MAG: type I DNA topoisomerase [Armatimonadetes bacterium]|nr:type I DNA topoisomerase [Armatimonadota bacterium]
MAKSLIIVESPAKIKTLKNFLGADYIFEASMGHVRDLPERVLGVDVDNDFAPSYESKADRKDVLGRIASAAKGVSTVYLASDPDREGEAIAWHLAEALKLKNPKRIQFNEITKTAVLQALEDAHSVDMDKVNAQQARRVLDRLVGYKLSPILSKKIQKGLSAGRVQSVAVRIICDRERAIQAFVPEEYWSLTANLTPQAPEKRFPFNAALHSWGKTKLEPKAEEDINVILSELEGANYSVHEVKKRETRRNASAPFITSTLQQEAARKLYFTSRRTMQVAQDLYEGVDLGAQGSVGLITYMRTDSVRVAGEAQGEARKFIAEHYGAQYVPAQAKQFKTKGGAQDAHEAIRPTSCLREPEAIAQYLNPEQLKLYRLIWQRFLASQMNPAILDVTTADIHALGGANTGTPYNFRATGSVVKFDGFMRVYTEGKDTEEVADEEQPPLPALSQGQNLDLLKLTPRQHFTQPPPRFTEATIVKTLEELGIGRPSTYASIISTIRDRGYVDLVDKRFSPTELGFTVTDQLVKHFPEIMDVTFTSGMETKLDSVEEGSANWVKLLRDFYDPFELTLKAAATGMESLKPAPIETEWRCPVEDKAFLLRKSRYGEFLGCSGFPKCRKIVKIDADGKPVDWENLVCGMGKGKEATTREPIDPTTLPNATEYACPDGKGVMILRSSRRGAFLGCSSYPKCSTLLKCSAEGVLDEGQEFKCTYDEKGKAKTTRKPAARKTTTTAKKTTTTTRARKTPKAEE